MRIKLVRTSPPWIVAIIFALSASSCRTPPQVDAIDPRALPRPDQAVLVGAGDIADCGPASMHTAHLVEQVLAASPRARAFTAGDNAYGSGTPGEFSRCYAPGWGRFRDRTLAVPGNHDWKTPGAAGFRGFFGLDKNAPTYRSTDVGSWHVVLLDSECKEVGGCEVDSPQGRWLASDLASHPARCTVAIMHKPRFSSGAHHGSEEAVSALWQILEGAGVDLVLGGHEHVYERFAPLRHDGNAAAGAGIPSIVVGTGGARSYPFGAKREVGSQASIGEVHGVLVLYLEGAGARGYFVDVHGSVKDEFTVPCR